VGALVLNRNMTLELKVSHSCGKLGNFWESYIFTVFKYLSIWIKWGLNFYCKKKRIVKQSTMCFF